MSLVKRPVVVLALIDSGGGADQICLRLSGIGWGCSPPLLFAHDRAVHSPRLLAAPSLPRGNEELAMVRRSQELIFLFCRSRHRFSLSPSSIGPLLFLVSGLGFRAGAAQFSRRDVLDLLVQVGALGRSRAPTDFFSCFFCSIFVQFYTKGRGKGKGLHGIPYSDVKGR